MLLPLGGAGGLQYLSSLWDTFTVSSLQSKRPAELKALVSSCSVAALLFIGERLLFTGLLDCEFIIKFKLW